MRGQNREKADEELPLKDNAILLYGDLDVLQWVAFELGEKGFDLRVACGKKLDAGKLSGYFMTRQKARCLHSILFCFTVEVFGLPGKNVDIVEVREDSSDDDFARAVDGAQAIGEHPLATESS
jgi:hypothetical protein